MRLVWWVSRLQRCASASLAITSPVAGSGPGRWWWEGCGSVRCGGGGGSGGGVLVVPGWRAVPRRLQHRQTLQHQARMSSTAKATTPVRTAQCVAPSPAAKPRCQALTRVQRLQQLRSLGAGGGAHVQHAVVRADVQEQGRHLRRGVHGCLCVAVHRHASVSGAPARCLERSEGGVGAECREVTALPMRQRTKGGAPSSCPGEPAASA